MNMTPKEQAEKLVHTYRMMLMDEDTECGNEVIVSLLSKKIAINTVSEIMMSNPHSMFEKKKKPTMAFWADVMVELEDL
jgi:hypothetical protein